MHDHRIVDVCARCAVYTATWQRTLLTTHAVCSTAVQPCSRAAIVIDDVCLIVMDLRNRGAALRARRSPSSV